MWRQELSPAFPYQNKDTIKQIVAIVTSCFHNRHNCRFVRFGIKMGKKIIWQNDTSRPTRTFLQPLAVGIACAVFVGLILTMGIMDIRRSERNLTAFLENQGLAIIDVVQRLAQENLNALVKIHQREAEKSYAPLTTAISAPQTWLTEALAELGKEVDNTWKADHLSEAGLKKFAKEKGLWLVAVMNKTGRVVFQNRPLSKDLFPDGKSLPKQPEITIELLTKLAQMKKIGYIALQRKDRSGTVIIALDGEGLRYWGLKVSVQKAIEKLGEGQKQGLVYMVVMNKTGLTLGSSGRIPEKWKSNDVKTSMLLAGVRKVESRKVLYFKKKLLDLAAPLYINGKVAGIVRVGLERENADVILEESKNTLSFFMAFVVLIALVSMWLLYHNQNRHLAGIVEIERRLEKAERLSALGKLAAGVAHEIRNPLNAISMASQRLRREFVPADEEKGRDFQLLSGVIRDEIRRLNGIIEEFLSFSKSRKLVLHSYPVADVLQKIVNLIDVEASARNIAIKTEWSNNHVIIPMDMDKLQQALLNFVKNAMESITGEGTIALSVAYKDKHYAIITISDTGCGMSVEEVDCIFNPEYTTKEKGLGLGLALAHEIIRGHGGGIHVISALGKGTTFEILLPAGKLA
jgi:signal transduction histidine kinase